MMKKTTGLISDKQMAIQCMFIDPVIQRFSNHVAQRAESVHNSKSKEVQNKLILLIHVWLKVWLLWNQQLTTNDTTVT